MLTVAGLLDTPAWYQRQTVPANILFLQTANHAAAACRQGQEVLLLFNYAFPSQDA